MALPHKILDQMRREPANVRFSDLKKICEMVFGPPRQHGTSHASSACHRQTGECTMNNDRYTYRVTWSPEDGEYIGQCAEFPSLSWLASTPEAALSGIRKVIAQVIADMAAMGETAPA